MNVRGGRCRCRNQIPTQSRDDYPHCDNCGGWVKPWSGLPGFERKCTACGKPIPPDRRSDARCCSDACRSDLSRRRRLTAGKPVGGYSDLDAYENRKRRQR